MPKVLTTWLAVGLALCPATSSLAATMADVEQWINRAAAAANEAAALKNQWTTTTQALSDAKQAAAAGRIEEAIERAHRAEALAKASIAQTKAEEQAWKDAVIR